MKKVSKLELRKASERSSTILAEWVRAQRLKNELTQGDLAKLAGVDRKTVNRIENYAFSPSVNTVTRLSVVMDAPIPELV